jgi:hypothetical protein
MHPAAGPGPLALVGSGEYLPVMAGVEGALIEGRPRRYVQIPTAAAPEGRQRLRYWLDLAAHGRSWRVHGRQQAWVLDGGIRRGFPAGATLPT